jgi:hypothetical protein
MRVLSLTLAVLLSGVTMTALVLMSFSTDESPVLFRLMGLMLPLVS